jgi:hypothetical protein
MLTVSIKPPRLCRSVHDRHTAHLWTGQRCPRRPLSRRIRHWDTILRPTGPIAGQRRRSSNTPGVNHRPEAQKTIHLSTMVSIYCDTSTGRPRPYVPSPLWLQVFQSVHDLSHPGTRVTAKLVAEHFVWPGVQKDCHTWARACLFCQHSKVSRHTVTPLGDSTPP